VNVVKLSVEDKNCGSSLSKVATIVVVVLVVVAVLSVRLLVIVEVTTVRWISGFTMKFVIMVAEKSIAVVVVVVRSVLGIKESASVDVTEAVRAVLLVLVDKL
jgi:hypothetical protein